MTRDARRGRRAYSLMEMVLVIGSVTVILTICGGFMHLLLRLEDAGRAAIADASHVARLARQLRRDVRDAATAAVPDGEPAGLDLEGDGGATIAYRPSGHGLLRAERRDGRDVRREAYDFGGLGPPRFVVEEGWVRLDLPRRMSEAGAVGRPGFSIEAELGKRRAKGRGDGGGK